MCDESKKLYTLEGARRELNKNECAAHGHRYEVIETTRPVALSCTRCGVSYKVVEEPDG